MTPDALSLPAPAKLNLFLHIIGRRHDGYHLLQTVFQLLDYGDTLHVRRRQDDQLLLHCSDPTLESRDNLVWRAADLLRRQDGRQLGADITLEKRLPMGGGLGGGSSDAASTLLALNLLWQCQLDLDSLAGLGLQLGADVPVFIHGHSAWADGVGDVLTPMALPEQWYVVLTPPCHAATAEIFSHQELTRDTQAIKIPAFPIQGSRNDCQAVACALYPEIGKTLEWLAQFGPARMTGTGASVFLPVDSEQKGLEILSLKPDIISAFLAKGVNNSPAHLAITACAQSRQ